MKTLSHFLQSQSQQYYQENSHSPCPGSRAARSRRSKPRVWHFRCAKTNPPPPPPSSAPCLFVRQSHFLTTSPLLPRTPASVSHASRYQRSGLWASRAEDATAMDIFLPQYCGEMFASRKERRKPDCHCWGSVFDRTAP